MTRVLAIDLGKTMGFGLLGGKRVLFGSREVVKRWSPYGASFLGLWAAIQALIDTHKPDYIAVARPFVRLDMPEPAPGQPEDPFRKYNDTTQNLVPMFGGFVVLHMVAAKNCKPVEVVEESAARSLMLGEGMCPRASARAKAAVMQACRDRGWLVEDDHAGDALCVGAAVLERLEPGQAHETTPLFIAAQPARKPRKAAR